MTKVLSLADYGAFVDGALAALLATEPNARLEVVGSLARGEARPPYSDIDLMLIAPDGVGPSLRDRVPKVAEAAGELLTIFVDPFSWQGCFCAVYDDLLKVDWFVADGEREDRRMVWSGEQPAPYDPIGHVWDWTWWIWGKIRSGKPDLAATELSKLWAFLVRRGVRSEVFPQHVPRPTDDLPFMLISTLQHLPTGPIADRVERAIRDESRPS